MKPDTKRRILSAKTPPHRCWYRLGAIPWLADGGGGSKILGNQELFN